MSGYELSARARLDLLQIWNFIAEQNIDAADKVIAKIREDLRLLADMPGLGHQRFDVPNAHLSFWSIYSYLIAYRADVKPVQVVRIVHGSRNIKRLFRGT